MKIVFLEAIHYPPQAPWIPVGTNQPTWEEIESAIRKLDRNEWPFVRLYINRPIQKVLQNNIFLVGGGVGEYCIFLLRDGHRIEFDDPSRGTETVLLGRSNQGSGIPRRALCNNLYRVLELVRFFALTGELSPDASWIEW